MSLLMSVCLFAVILVLPIKVAADFTDGRNTGLLACGIAALVAPSISALSFRISSGGLLGIAMALTVGLTAYVIILKIPRRSVVGFSVIVVALQLAVLGALVSFGINLGKMIVS
jgi:hypothetical protein